MQNLDAPKDQPSHADDPEAESEDDSAMENEGDRPAPEHGSVEEDRPSHRDGGMMGEG